MTPVQAAQVLRMLDDGRLKDAAEAYTNGPEFQRALLRRLQERYPEAVSAFHARGRFRSGLPGREGG